VQSDGEIVRTASLRADLSAPAAPMVSPSRLAPILDSVDRSPAMNIDSTTSSRLAPAVPSSDGVRAPRDAEHVAPTPVLVVDDEPLIRWAVSEFLQDLGCDVRQAGDGHSALSKIADRAAFEIVMLDVRLPDCSDFALLMQVHARMPDARIIVMTAHGTQELFDEALALGAFSVLSKPFELADLAAIVARARLAPAG
jgi:CheY-like chemotaxis protein